MKQHDVRSHLPHQLIHDVYVLLDDGDRRALAHTNLTPLEFNLLLQLDLEQGQRLTDVGAKLLCVKSTITRLVDRLERDGLVRRNPDPDDRRAQRLILTPRGAAVRAEALAMHNAAVERRMNLLDPEEQEQLTRLLLKLRDGLAADLAAQQAVEAETWLFPPSLQILCLCSNGILHDTAALTTGKIACISFDWRWVGWSGLR